MRFAQFYQMSTGYVEGTIPPRFDDAHKKPTEACGDRAVIQIDARLKPKTAGEIAASECQKRGFCGWRIFEGDSFSSAKPISGYWPAPYKQDKTAFSAYYGA